VRDVENKHSTEIGACLTFRVNAHTHVQAFSTSQRQSSACSQLSPALARLSLSIGVHVRVLTATYGSPDCEVALKQRYLVSETPEWHDISGRTTAKPGP